MASLVAETWAKSSGDDVSNGVQISNFNSSLLISLLEESHCEEYNEEQLNRVIQSLEAEINERNMLGEDHDLAMELTEFPRDDEGDGQNCLASMEFRWPDNMELAPLSPSHVMNCNVDHCGYELDDLVEYEGVCDYSEIYNFVSLEEHGFSSSWQEIYETATYD